MTVSAGALPAHHAGPAPAPLAMTAPLPAATAPLPAATAHHAGTAVALPPVSAAYPPETRLLRSKLEQCLGRLYVTFLSGCQQAPQFGTSDVFGFHVRRPHLLSCMCAEYAFGAFGSVNSCAVSF